MTDKPDAAQAAMPPLPALSLETWPVARLRPYKRNPRKNDAAVDRMAESIRQYGFTVPCLVKADGQVIDGHLRIKAAEKTGIAEIPVVIADHLSPAQVKAFRIMANQSANWAKWDIPLLKLEIADLTAANFDLSLTGFDTKFFNDLDLSASIRMEPPDPAALLDPPASPAPAPEPGFPAQSQDAADTDDDWQDRQGPQPSYDNDPPERRIPLSIVLTPAEYSAWAAFKDSIGVKSDTPAFRELMKAVAEK
jgi:hypothetical protein